MRYGNRGHPAEHEINNNREPIKTAGESDLKNDPRYCSDPDYDRESQRLRGTQFDLACAIRSNLDHCWRARDTERPPARRRKQHRSERLCSARCHTEPGPTSRALVPLLAGKVVLDSANPYPQRDGGMRCVSGLSRGMLKREERRCSRQAPRA